VGPACPSLGFVGYSRTCGMLHANCASPDEEEGLLARYEGDASVVPGRMIQDHLSFSYRHKICMMYFLSGGGGVLTLHPANRNGEDITLACCENQLVAFRHDLCDYTYQPGSGQLALQAWICREPQAGEPEVSQPLSHKVASDYEKMPKQPQYGHTNQATECMSLAVRLPGEVWNGEAYWIGLSSGFDGVCKIPLTRWDADFYYCDDAQMATSPGKSYVQHFGMLCDEQMATFDNEFFGIAADEMRSVDPPARALMETGYDCLYRAGWNRSKLSKAEIVTCYGFCSSDYASTMSRFCIEPGLLFNMTPQVAASRLQYIFGFKGPATTIETACSSSLYATAIVHSHMRPQMSDQSRASTAKRMKYGMAAGGNGNFDPFYSISLANAKMLSLSGRCYTFDASADGYLRAEACGCMYYKTGDREDLASLAYLAGTRMNQDGRSANMTAPNGPSQQECIRYSLREAGIRALDIQIQELHGTGTALGDPIEVGALRATMMMEDGDVREHPLVKTSSKSNVGHTELSAGIVGIMKCVLMGCNCTASPGVHIRLLNPHIDNNSYPVYFNSEHVDQGKNWGYHGVSSFGFSGCNARGDIWARGLSGPRNTQPGMPLLNLTPARIYTCSMLYDKICEPSPGMPPNKNLERLDCYSDCYISGTPMDSENKFYCSGSFNGWSCMEPMTWLEDLQAYTFCIELGDTGVEQFQIVVNKDDYYTIFPASNMAEQDALILGPGMAPPGHNWMIDGRKFGAKAKGTVYMVLFSWDEDSRRKRIVWSPSEEASSLGLAASKTFHHKYAIVGSWSAWKPVEMRAAKEPGVHTVKVSIGLEGLEHFQFQRDRDPMQAIYPAGKAVANVSVPVRGPDHLGEGKHWMVTGSTGDEVTISLKVASGSITVTTICLASGIQEWTSLAPRRYFVTASFNDWYHTEMLPEPGADGQALKARIYLRGGEQAFHIVVDNDPNLTIHPELHMADQLQSLALGPDAKGRGLHWGLVGELGELLDITLDLSQADRRKAVTWTFVDR